ncbi:hypothetical protein [Leptospira noguchii]|uniref:Uncharacterized protein n=1 Tax=Leptospira noguchii TaxID=28182 RepID=A0AAE9GIX9_9LEPT|nr:hypothetical protein [Leptospira noguchii]UOG58797.1 hypothetical protein MAL03_20375 [Leptospira noguchii]
MENEIHNKSEATFFEQLKNAASERLGSPFYFSFIVSFVLCNWELFYILIYEKYKYLQFNLFLSHYSVSWVRPFLWASAYSAVYIIPNVFFDFIAHIYKTKGENRKNLYSKNNLYLDKRTEIDIEERFRNTIQLKSNEINDKARIIHENDKRNESKLLKLFAESKGYENNNILIRKKYPKDNISEYKGRVVLSHGEHSYVFVYNSPDAPF